MMNLTIYETIYKQCIFLRKQLIIVSPFGRIPQSPSGTAPFRQGSLGFVLISGIIVPSSPRRVAAKLTGGVLNFAQHLWVEDTLESSYKLQSLQFLLSPAKFA